VTQSKRWIVTASPDHAFGEVAGAVAQAGLRIEQRLDDIGVLVGMADEETAKRLRTVAGVADVSPDEAIDIGPPGSPRTW
jgi:hypothetical protein